MNDGYTKLYSSLVLSTVWQEPNHIRIVWVTMLALCDSTGYVGASVPGLARVALVTVRECEAALQRLLEPDPYSRTPDHEGRRIAVADGGWKLLNHAKYAEGRDLDRRREQNREAQRRRRGQHCQHDVSKPDDVSMTSACQHDVSTVSMTSAKSATSAPTNTPTSTSASADTKPTDRSRARKASPSVGQSARQPCPPDLTLTPDQRSTLEGGMIPAWVIDRLTPELVASWIGSETLEPRTPAAWRTTLVKAITSRWHDPSTRPKRGETERTAEEWAAVAAERDRCDQANRAKRRREMHERVKARGLEVPNAPRSGKVTAADLEKIL